MGWAEDVAAVREQVLRAPAPDVVTRDGSIVPFLEHRISSDFHISRFLTARERNVTAASAMLVAHLHWRRSFFPIESTPAIRAMWETKGGPDDCPRLRRAGWTKDRRPVVILHFWRGEFWEDGVTLVDAIRGFVDFLEELLVACEDEAGPRGTEVKCIIAGGPAPGQFAKRLVKIVEANFPEVCFLGLIYPIPRLIKVMVATLLWFIPARTRQKVQVLTTEAQLVQALNIDAKDLPEDLRGGIKAAVRRFRPDTASKQWRFLQEMLNKDDRDGYGGGSSSDERLHAGRDSPKVQSAVAEEESGGFWNRAMVCCVSRPRDGSSSNGASVHGSCFQRAWHVEEPQVQSSAAVGHTGRPRPAQSPEFARPPEPESKHHGCFNFRFILMTVLLISFLQCLRVQAGLATGNGNDTMHNNGVQAKAFGNYAVLVSGVVLAASLSRYRASSPVR
mmetsp:Transcript_151329/g.267086  ORF Transcript_151329/g.267086 Transcript_151329/m.267086 type:complete len:447 (-) Transcript_151329:75-1415(-)